MWYKVNKRLIWTKQVRPTFQLKKIFDFSTQDLHWFTYRKTSTYWLYIDTTNHYCTNTITWSSYGAYGCYYKQVNYKKCRQRIKWHLIWWWSFMCWVWNDYAPNSWFSVSLWDDFSKFFVGIKWQSSYKNFSYPSWYVKTDDHYFDTIFDNWALTTRVLDLNENVLWEATNTSSETTQKYIWFCWWTSYNNSIYIKEYRLAYEE